MTNNFELIKNLCIFESSDDFYYINIIKRRKENPNMSRSQKKVDEFFIYESSDFDKIKYKVIKSCEDHNARAYIVLNKRSLRKIALQTQKKIIDLLIDGNHKAVKQAYSSCCGKFSNESGSNKKWIIDIDTKDEAVLNKALEKVAELMDDKREIKAVIPTPNGYHIVCNPFNPKMLNKSYELKKQGMTVLYCP